MPPSRRILHVVTSLEPGGMENGVANLSHAMAPHGFETHVACLERSGEFASRLREPAKVQVLGKGEGFSLAAAARLRRLARQIQPALIHAHNLGPLIYAAGASFFGRTWPLLQGEHSQLTPEELSPRRLRQRRLLYGACAVVHTVSEGIAAQIRGLHLPTRALAVVPNGVDTQRFSPGPSKDARARWKLSPSAFLVGIVGRFGPFKRHAVLLEAFRRLAPAWPELELLVAGRGGSEEATLRAQWANEPAPSRVHWLGHQAEPAECLRALDLLVIPSVNEGFSNVALEAMSCGVPVLANTGCGHEYFLAHGVEGMIADLSTPAVLAEALAACRDRRPWLAELGERGRARAVAEFSLEKMAARYAELYRRVGGPGP